MSKITITMDKKVRNTEAGQISRQVQDFLASIGITEANGTLTGFTFEENTQTKTDILLEYLAALLNEGRAYEAPKTLAVNAKVSTATISNLFNGKVQLDASEQGIVDAYVALEKETKARKSLIREFKSLANNPLISREVLQGLCANAGVDLADVLAASDDDDAESDTDTVSADV